MRLTVLRALQSLDQRGKAASRAPPDAPRALLLARPQLGLQRPCPSRGAAGGESRHTQQHLWRGTEGSSPREEALPGLWGTLNSPISAAVSLG